LGEKKHALVLKALAIQNDMNRNETLNQISELLLNYPSNNKPLLVGIDGFDGAGKTYMADEIHSNLMTKTKRKSVRISIDEFHNSKRNRYKKGKNSPEGFYQDSYNYEKFIKYVIEPLKSEAEEKVITTAAFDCENDCDIDGKRIKISNNSIVLIDGIFLHRASLRNFWDLTLFLKTDFEVSIPRGNSRSGVTLSSNPLDPENSRYVKGQEMYLKECNPELAATIVINNNDLESAYIIAKK